jgi:DNA polymerase IV
MERLGIITGEDLRGKDRAFLDRSFGKSGGYYYWASRGIDHRPVNPNQERKSIGSETTFGTDLWTREACMDALTPLIESVARHCAKRTISGRTVTLKLRYSDFRTLTRSRSVPRPLSEPSEIGEVIASLLSGLIPLPLGVRLLGVTLSALSGGDAEEVSADIGQGSLL